MIFEIFFCYYFSQMFLFHLFPPIHISFFVFLYFRQISNSFFVLLRGQIIVLLSFFLFLYWTYIPAKFFLRYLSYTPSIVLHTSLLLFFFHFLFTCSFLPVPFIYFIDSFILSCLLLLFFFRTAHFIILLLTIFFLYS
jgi:hypothetical protein